MYVSVAPRDSSPEGRSAFQRRAAAGGSPRNVVVSRERNRADGGSSRRLFLLCPSSRASIAERHTFGLEYFVWQDRIHVMPTTLLRDAHKRTRPRRRVCAKFQAGHWRSFLPMHHFSRAEINDFACLCLVYERNKQTFPQRENARRSCLLLIAWNIVAGEIGRSVSCSS